MTKKIFCLLFFVLATFFLTTPFVFAEDCDPSKCNSNDAGCLETQKTICEKKVSELGAAKNTLANQIKILTSQYELTQLKITQTENSIKSLEQEINNLSVEIDKLNVQLDDLSQLFIYQTAQNYKNQKKAPLFFFLLKANLNDFLQQNQYVSSVRQNNQENLIKMGTVKERYDIQKTAKTKKQQEMEDLQKTLASQKTTLNNQKSAKDKLLEITKNDEKEYQKRLLAVQSKLSSFASVGAECLSTPAGTGSDGNYFSQIDPRWCSQKPAGTEGCKVGNTNKPCTIGNIGCYITSTAIVLKKLGISTNPSIYASDINHIESSADMKPIDVPSGYKYCEYKSAFHSQQDIYKVIDSELSSGRYVIAQVPMNPYHFIVLIKGSNGNYTMHDPWKGADKPFSYNKIISIRLITTQSCP